jgi:ApbE superfamily uncharacterized protein (UPF0280 family)
MYEQRTYRHSIQDSDLVSFTVKVKETDLYIRAKKDLSYEALAAIDACRVPLEKYIGGHPVFLHSLEPVSADPGAPEIVKMMVQAGNAANVGPMAAVAGAIAETVGKKLMAYSSEIIVENGGDIFMKIDKRRSVGIYAGCSNFSGKLALEIIPRQSPIGICTSSGTVGPSLSLGLADAVIVLSPSAALADATATAVGNYVKEKEDINRALELGQVIDGISGIVIILGDSLGVWGEVKLIPL